jgi:hypothetical protein
MGAVMAVIMSIIILRGGSIFLFIFCSFFEDRRAGAEVGRPGCGDNRQLTWTHMYSKQLSISTQARQLPVRPKLEAGQKGEGPLTCTVA